MIRNLATKQLPAGCVLRFPDTPLRCPDDRPVSTGRSCCGVQRVTRGKKKIRRIAGAFANPLILFGLALMFTVGDWCAPDFSLSGSADLLAMAWICGILCMIRKARSRNAAERLRNLIPFSYRPGDGGPQPDDIHAADPVPAGKLWAPRKKDRTPDRSLEHWNPEV